MQTVSIGPLGFSFAHVLLVLSFIVALLVGALYGRKHGVSIGGTLVDTLLVALVTARIGFVVQYFEHFQDAPLDIIDIRDAVWTDDLGRTLADGKSDRSAAQGDSG